MEINEIVKLLFTYGPYAVLTLFSLWIAPRQTIYFMDANKDPVKTPIMASIVIACWLTVIFMVYFVYKSWPPKMAYTGSFGVFSEKYDISPTTSSNLYITANLTNNNTRVVWNYAIISTVNEIGHSGDDFSFAVEWCENDKSISDEMCDYKVEDYSISANLLQPHKILNFIPKFLPNLRMYYDHDNNLETDDKELKPASSDYSSVFHDGGLNIIKAVYAQEIPDFKIIIENLSSSNKYVRADARKELRKLSIDVLEEMKLYEDLSRRARSQIDSELENRD